MHQQNRPPAIVLGGSIGALSIARALGSDGVRVYALNSEASEVRYSRFVHWIPSAHPANEIAWERYLLGPESEFLRGAVLLAACDEAVQLIATHYEELSRKFLLDASSPAAQLQMLDKLQTYHAARQAGVATPKYWVPRSWDDVVAVREELVYPLMVKPLSGHQFRAAFKDQPNLQKGYPVVRSFDDLRRVFRMVESADVAVFLVEFISGPDSNLCSYYTYIDESGRNLFDYTKRIIRRYPAGTGGSTYHITDRVAHISEPSLALLRHIQLRGIANLEFKLDPRDGELKLIECNVRFTAADCLLRASGLNLPCFVYSRITQAAYELPADYARGKRLWKPFSDCASFWELHQKGELALLDWLKSILHPQVFPVFEWNDPLPAIMQMCKRGSYIYHRAAEAVAGKRPAMVRTRQVAAAGEMIAGPADDL